MSHEDKVLAYWADQEDNGVSMFTMDDQLVMAELFLRVCRKHFDGQSVNTEELFEEMGISDQYLTQMSSWIDSVMNPDPVELEDYDYLDEEEEDE